MYGDIESVVRMSGFFLRPFAVEHSVQQGYTLSLLLYAVVLEPLLWRLEAMSVIYL